MELSSGGVDAKLKEDEIRRAGQQRLKAQRKHRRPRPWNAEIEQRSVGLVWPPGRQPRDQALWV